MSEDWRVHTSRRGICGAIWAASDMGLANWERLAAAIKKCAIATGAIFRSEFSSQMRYRQSEIWLINPQVIPVRLLHSFALFSAILQEFANKIFIASFFVPEPWLSVERCVHILTILTRNSSSSATLAQMQLGWLVSLASVDTQSLLAATAHSSLQYVAFW